jgi:hypothetical protein
MTQSLAASAQRLVLPTTWPSHAHAGMTHFCSDRVTH